MTRLALLTLLSLSTATFAQSEPPLVPSPSSEFTGPSAPVQAPVAKQRAHTRPRMGLVVAGAVTFGVVYNLSAIGGLLYKLIAWSGPNTTLALIPVVGPLLGTNDQLFPLSVVSTALQVSGLLMLTAGFIFPQTVWTLERDGFAMEVSPTGIRGTF